jgi:hypothetical protein
MANDILDRRGALGVLAGLGGAFALGGSALLGRSLAAATPAAAPASSMAHLPWPYRPVDPDTAGQRAFEGYQKGHCMYGTFEAIVGAVVEKLGPPYTGFPFEMFIYGMGGVYGWGTLCGTLNGCAAAIQVLSREHAPAQLRAQGDEVQDRAKSRRLSALPSLHRQVVRGFGEAGLFAGTG